MPNYCYNYIHIHAEDESALEKILEDICYTPKDESLRPYMLDRFPDEFEEDQMLPTFQKLIPTTEDDDLVQKWGTKWDMMLPVLRKKDNNFASISFDTAWSPPQQWFELLCQRHEDVTIILESEEPWMSFSIIQWHLANRQYFYSEREYKSPCVLCFKYHTSEYREDEDSCLCDECFKSESEKNE